jgi:hypothetical protein
MYLKLDNQLHLSEENPPASDPAPRDFLDAIEKEFRDIFDQ